MSSKNEFKNQLKDFAQGITKNLQSENGQWYVKGFIDTFKNIYTLSSDTKIISKVLEIHLFPEILKFAQTHGYDIVLAEYQNHYPDISFVKSDDKSIRFAVDFKTSYRNLNKPHLCNGFTLGSHGKYFQDRTSTKNIKFPYGTYKGHFCLGIVYDREKDSNLNEKSIYSLDELQSITSVVKNFQSFVAEKWLMASDKSGSGNTANIGSISKIDDIINEKGMFSKLGEKWFDDYWMNFNKIIIPDGQGGTRKVNNLEDFVKYRKGDISLIVPKNTKA